MTREEVKEWLISHFGIEKDGTKQSEVMNYLVDMLEQEPKPMEKFESTKDHIFKLAGDYKCWDNRLTWDEALELCHMLEQEPTKEEKILLKKWRDNRGISMEEFGEAMDALREQEPKTEWIPVSEKLPEKSTCCLFTIFEPAYYDNDLDVNVQEEIKTVYGEVRVFVKNERSWSWENEDGFNSCIFNEYGKEDYGLESFITAWMPLPEPYSEVSE